MSGQEAATARTGDEVSAAYGKTRSKIVGAKRRDSRPGSERCGRCGLSLELSGLRAGGSGKRLNTRASEVLQPGNRAGLAGRSGVFVTFVGCDGSSCVDASEPRRSG